MATFEATLQTALGTLCSDECYPVVNASKVIASSYITYQIINKTPLFLSSSGDGCERVQIDVFGATYGAAKALAASVKTTVDLTFPANQKIMDFDGYESVSKEYRVTLEYYIWQ